MTKEEIQKRVLQDGIPLDINKFTWEENKKIFCCFEENLELNFSGISGCIFITAGFCNFKTGDYCMFITQSYCRFEIGSNCNLFTGENASIIASGYRSQTYIPYLNSDLTIPLNIFGILSKVNPSAEYKVKELITFFEKVLISYPKESEVLGFECNRYSNDPKFKVIIKNENIGNNISTEITVCEFRRK